MDERPLGTTGYGVTEVGMGTWNIGGDWGDVTDEQGRAAIEATLDAGVNFLDTADVYGDGRSERLIREVLAEREEGPVVATKAGRRLDPHEPDRYTEANLRRFVDRSRGNLGVETVQIIFNPFRQRPRDLFFDRARSRNVGVIVRVPLASGLVTRAGA
jgi:aryl-alcohol dehydrogenase-like predicted oxidoreductase